MSNILLYTQCWSWTARLMFESVLHQRPIPRFPLRRTESPSRARSEGQQSQGLSAVSRLIALHYLTTRATGNPPLSSVPWVLIPCLMFLCLRLYSLHHACFLADMTFVTNRDEGHLTWLVIEVARNINHMHQVYNCLLKIWGTDPLPAFPQELIRKWAEPQVRTKRGTELALHFFDTCYVGSVKCNFFGCPCVNFSLTDL